jgi:hypothetical protein
MTEAQAGKVRHIVAVHGVVSRYAIECMITRKQAEAMRVEGIEVLEVDTKTGAKVATAKVRK